jgi:hypothetical protein
MASSDVKAVDGNVPSASAAWPPGKIQAILAALAALTGATLGIITSFGVVHWTPAQTTLAGTEAAAFWAFAAAAVAHFWPGTKKQPVALAGTFTALASATVSLGVGFSWWHLTASQNASLISVVTAIIAVGSALLARNTVTAGVTPSRH